LLQAWNINEEIYFSMNGVSWYLSVCVFLYFCFPWILKVIEKYRNRKIANIAMIMTWGGQIIISYFLSILPVSDLLRDSFIHWGVYICPLMRFGDFFIGCNLGYLFLTRTIVGKDKLYKSNETGKKDFFVLAIIIIQWIVHIYYSNKLLVNIPHPETWWTNTIFFTWSSCCLIYLFAQKDRKNLGKYQRILVYVGNISSYTFLVHLVIIRYIRICVAKLYGINIQGTVTLAVSAFIITVVVSEIYKLLEISFLKRYRE